MFFKKKIRKVWQKSSSLPTKFSDFVIYYKKNRTIGTLRIEDQQQWERMLKILHFDMWAYFDDLV